MKDILDKVCGDNIKEMCPEKEIDNSNQIIKGYEDYIGDDKIRKVYKK